MNLEILERVLIQECKIEKQKPILVGVSGGGDSLCLLHLLKNMGYRVIAIHVDHQLRPESGQEAELVRQYCITWKIPFISRHVDVNAYIEEKRLSLEESARILRYTVMMQTAVEESVQALAVAHHANDQIETVLMHILRGAGTSGLRGMAYRSYNLIFSETIPVVRPLLGVWRQEIEQYCIENQIIPCQDQTNSDTTFFRNRIRHELIPTLNTYNSQANQHLWQLSQISGEEDRYLNQKTQELGNKIVKQTGPGFLILDTRLFSETDIVLQRRLMRHFLESLRSNLRDIGFESVEKGIEFINDHPGKGEWQLLEGVQLTAIDQKQIMIYTDEAKLNQLWPLLDTEKSGEVSFSGETSLNQHWKITAQIMDANNFDLKKDPNWAYFDLDLIRGPLRIGLRKDGETFSPFGMQGKKTKVGNYFTNNYVSEIARKRWPIIRMGEQIIWIIGMRQSSVAPISASTRKILALHLVQED